MKIRKKANATFGPDTVDVALPKGWKDVTQTELHYIYYLRSNSAMEPGEVKRLFFLRKAGLNPVRKVDDSVWLFECPEGLCRINLSSLAWGVQQLDWMDDLPPEPIRLDRIGQAKAVNAVLHGVSFGDWISLENLYQGFILSKNPNALRRMAKYLYPGTALADVSDLDIYNISQWYAGIKVFFARKWSDLFAGSGDAGGGYNPEASMNAMIRALTGGDVLKEQPLLKDIDVWRALEELNQKAKEAAEFKAKLK